MRRTMLAALLLAAVAVPARAVNTPAEMLADPAQEARAERIGSELRCLVCQNESIEDSGADLARDLRRLVRQRVRAGQSDRQIVDWMVARYGEFVRLRPRFGLPTALLWLTPVLAPLAGLGIALSARRARPAPPPALSARETERMRGLLEPLPRDRGPG